jgi:uncharacterized 2Fe-2S/4Fe-4S cluster protein (DUF4445 family)
MHRVTFIPRDVTTKSPDGATLFDAANWAGLLIDSACGGRGTCGKCRVRIRGGIESDAEWVLACRTRVHRDCTVEIPQPARALQTVALGGHRSVTLDPNVRKVLVEGRTNVVCGEEVIAVEPGDTRDFNFGLALDIGTTTVAGALIDLNSGVVKAREALLNGQSAYGADVIGRISHAGRDHGRVELQESVVRTINELIGRIGAPRQHLYEAVVVGNATMLHLLLGVDPSGIGVSPFVPAFRRARTVRAADLGLRLHPEARLSTLPILGSYVGADIVGGLLATEFLRGADGTLRVFVDAGTNGEIVVRRRDQCFCAAAPAGPAFEGAEIRCGMRAAAGAIEHVEIGEEVRVQIVGGGKHATGICGSGLIDAVAEMRKARLLEASGRMRGRAELRLGAAEDAVVLTQADVRALQYAKAAIAAGTAVLLQRLGERPENVEEVLLAGAFGSFLRPASARAIGLVPWIALERIRAVGNAAGEGAIAALLSRRERAAARQIPQYVKYVELSGDPAFNTQFPVALGFPVDPGLQ